MGCLRLRCCVAPSLLTNGATLCCSRARSWPLMSTPALAWMWVVPFSSTAIHPVLGSSPVSPSAHTLQQHPMPTQSIHATNASLIVPCAVCVGLWLSKCSFAFPTTKRNETKTKTKTKTKRSASHVCLARHVPIRKVIYFQNRKATSVCVGRFFFFACLHFPSLPFLFLLLPFLHCAALHFHCTALHFTPPFLSKQDAWERCWAASAERGGGGGGCGWVGWASADGGCVVRKARPGPRRAASFRGRSTRAVHIHGQAHTALL